MKCDDVKFDKYFGNNDYEIFFSSIDGIEIMRGRNGKDDPFALALPSLLDIGIMGHCKHKCPFCYQGHTDEPNMKFEDYKRIIDQIKFHVNQVALGGRGDPNHHKNFREIVEYSRNNGVVPNYTTSGIDLTDIQIENSKLCGAVAVSEYGQPHTYEAIRKFMNAHIKTNIHMILTNTSYYTAIKILHGYNPWRINEIKSNVDIERLNAIIFLLFKSAGAAESFDWQPNKLQLNTFAQNVFKPDSVFKIGMDSCLVNHVLQYVKLDSLQRMSVDSCEGARMSAYITPDMKMMPCSFANKNQWAIPITEKQNIFNIWNKSKPFKAFRKVLHKNSFSCPLSL